MLCGALLLMPRGLLDRSLLSMAARVVLAGGLLVVVTRGLLGLSLPLLVTLVPGGLAFLSGILVLGAVSLSELRQARQFALGMVRSKLVRSA